MTELNPVVFDLLIGERASQAGSGICVAKDIKLGLIDLGKKPFELKKTSVTGKYPDAIDIVTTPMLWNGRPVVMTVSSSQNGKVLFLDYDNLTKIDEVGLNLQSKFAGYHGVEAIDGNRFAIAVSNSEGKVSLVDKTGTEIWQETLLGAHQVIWDSTAERLFALGKTELRVYQFTEKSGVKRCGTVDFSELYTEIYNDRSDKSGQNWADGGHDLYFDAGNRKMFLTTGERVYSFCIDNLLTQFSHSEKIVWQLDQLFSFNAINPVKSLYQVRSVLSDDYIHSGSARKEWRPPNKSGCKALSRVPGSSLIVSHCAPDYYGATESPYATNTLVVSRGDEDLPNLYEFTPDAGDYSSLKILSYTLGDNKESLTYRCRIKPKLPLTPYKTRELEESSMSNLTFKGVSGGLGKVGGPYIQLVIKGKAQEVLVQKLYNDFHAARSSDDFSQDVYGFCQVEIDEVINEAIFKVYTSKGDAGNGYLVNKKLNLYLAVYTWAEPVQLHWQLGADFSLCGQLIDMRNQRTLDVLWVSVNGESAVDMSEFIASDKRRFTIHLDKKFAENQIKSLALYAMSDEGYLACSGERQFMPRMISPELIMNTLSIKKTPQETLTVEYKLQGTDIKHDASSYQWQYRDDSSSDWKDFSKPDDNARWGRERTLTLGDDYAGKQVRVAITPKSDGGRLGKTVYSDPVTLAKSGPKDDAITGKPEVKGLKLNKAGN
ncbi:hypothetical protein ACTVKR_24635, partial [Serratia bockelmannii]|uniref:hypothetical protein n=1 Tax=Serratia bockelmannii TaxID=2703793 RepID=UPI003FA7676E